AGDMVVENRHFTAVFSGDRGKVLLYAKPRGSAGPSAESEFGEKIGEMTLLHASEARIKKLNLLRNSADEVAAEVHFTGKGSTDIPVTVEFGKTEIIEINAPRGSGVSLRGPIEYGIVPSFVGDDLIFGPVQDVESNGLAVPAENFVLALL